MEGIFLDVASFYFDELKVGRHTSLTGGLGKDNHPRTARNYWESPR